MVCVLGWTLAASLVAVEAAKAAAPETFRMPDGLLRSRLYLSQLFTCSLFLLLTGLGLSGWVRARALGSVPTAVSSVAIIASIFVPPPFIR